MTKTVEITKTMDGCYVTRRYHGQTMGNQFFSSVVPADKKTKKQKKAWLEQKEAEKEQYINEWING